MIDVMPTADIANPERFKRTGVAADAPTAATVRDQFAQWLRKFFTLDPIRSSDLVLAVNEALANCAEFAYCDASAAGTMDVEARYLEADSTLVVSVSDRGTWHDRTRPRPRTRGRGIPLMKALSDRTSIDTSETGTHVRLEWEDVESAAAAR